MVKGVILHGGAGTRLRPLTFSGPKQLIPVANKPISQYALEDLLACGVSEVAIVLGGTFPELVRNHYGDGSGFNARITYVYQGQPLGIAHAVSLCRDFVGDDSFIVYLGDNLLQNGVKNYLKRFIEGGYDAFVLLKEVEDPSRFGVAQFDEKGSLVRLVEKPRVPPSKYALVGVYFFKPVVFEAIRELKPSWRGELEITDAIQLLMDKGCRVGYSIVEGWWLDTGKKDDVLYANMLILDERARRSIEGEVLNSRVDGRVSIGKKTRVVDSTVRGPVVIGEGCLIQGSSIGPYTSVGDNSQIINSAVENCIMLEGSLVKDIDRIEESLVGRNARVLRNERNRVLRLHLGDYSEVEV